jgi:hypothetical protein
MYEPDKGLPRGLDYRTACQLLAAVVKTALVDVRAGVEPRASEAGEWLDTYTNADWRRVLDEEPRGRLRKKAS